MTWDDSDLIFLESYTRSGIKCAEYGSGPWRRYLPAWKTWVGQCWAYLVWGSSTIKIKLIGSTRLSVSPLLWTGGQGKAARRGVVHPPLFMSLFIASYCHYRHTSPARPKAKSGRWSYRSFSPNWASLRLSANYSGYSYRLRFTRDRQTQAFGAPAGFR